MKQLKLIRNIDALDGEIQFNFEPGRIEGVLVVVEGTNDSGQTGTNEDVGRFIIERRGNQTHNRNFNVFQDIGDIRGGTNLSTSVTAGEFLMSCFIPFFEIGFPNALNITGASELNLRFQPDADAETVFTSLNVKVYAQIADLGEAYQYTMMGNDLSIASQTQQLEQLNENNVSALYVDDVDSVLDFVQFEQRPVGAQSGMITVSNIDFEALRAYTIYNNRIEDATFTLAQIMAATPGVPASARNRDSNIRVTTTGAGDIDITVCSMKFGEAA